MICCHFHANMKVQTAMCKDNNNSKSRAATCMNHYIFIIFQLWLTSHQTTTVLLLDTGTPGTSRGIYSEDTNGETRTRNPSVINQVP